MPNRLILSFTLDLRYSTFIFHHKCTEFILLGKRNDIYPWYDQIKNQNHLLCQNDVVISFVERVNQGSIRSSDNDSTGFWPPGSLHTLGADGHIKQRDRLLMAIKILCIEYILWGIPTIESTFDVANMVKTATVKDVPINNDALLNIQAC